MSGPGALEGQWATCPYSIATPGSEGRVPEVTEEAHSKTTAFTELCGEGAEERSLNQPTHRSKCESECR